jgi:alkylation response protein AidB-like acyl-CoA dehydrogenase
MARSIDALLDGVRARHDDLDATAAEADETGRAPDALLDVMRDLRVSMVKAPLEVGGDLLSFRDQLRYFEALSYSNPTAGWVGFNNAGAASMTAALFPQACLDEVFGSGESPFFAAVSNPSGTFVPVDGGIEVSGRYRYASGVLHSEWVMLPAIEAADEPGVRMFVVPASDITIDGTWDVMALKGTGSLDVVLDGVFVPEHRTVDPLPGPQRGGPRFAVGYQAFVSAENFGFTLGVCQRFLDELATYAGAKSRLLDGRLADRGAFQYELGKGQLQMNAARAYALDALGRADDLCEANAGLSADDEQDVVAMAAFCTESAVEVVTHLFHFAGAGAIFDSSILQRGLRDAQGSAQHHVASNIVYDRFGRRLLGVEP